MNAALSWTHRWKKKERKKRKSGYLAGAAKNVIPGHVRAAESFPWFCPWHGEGQENSWEPRQSPTDPRCSHLARALPVPFLVQCLYLSPQWKGEKKKKRTGNAVFQLWNWLFFCQLLSCAFPRFIPDVANLEWRWRSYAEAIQTSRRSWRSRF